MTALARTQFAHAATSGRRHIAERANRIDRLVGVSTINELMEAHIISAFLRLHVRVTQRGCYEILEPAGAAPTYLPLRQ